MPIYDYKCPLCDLTKEIIDLRSVADREAQPHKLKCAACNTDMVRADVNRTSWQWGEGPKQSNISRGIERVKKAGL